MVPKNRAKEETRADPKCVWQTNWENLMAALCKILLMTKLRWICKETSQTLYAED